MLKEIRNVRQIPGESLRRSFADGEIDLTVWFGERDEITGFELCYDKRGVERALRWLRDGGFSHNRVNDGEQRTGKKGTPVLVPDGAIDGEKISRLFWEHSREMDVGIADFIADKLAGLRQDRFAPE